MSRNIHTELPTTHPYSLFPHPAGAPSMRQTTPLPPPPSGLKADAGERAAGYKYAQGTAANSLPCHSLGGDRVGWLLGRSQGCPVLGPAGSGASKRLLHFFCPFRREGTTTTPFSWMFAHLLSSGVPSFLDHIGELGRNGPKATGAAQHLSHTHLLSAKPKFIHSFSRHLLRAS